MSEKQRYRFRKPSTGEERIIEAEPDRVYVDPDNGEELQVVAKVLPLAPSPSNLPWSVENLRMCGCKREQFIQKDVNDCPYCNRRIEAL